MIFKNFLLKLIEHSPSRGLDNVDVYIWSKNPEDPEESIGYKIWGISNKGSNDGVFIEIKEREK